MFETIEYLFARGGRRRPFIRSDFIQLVFCVIIIGFYVALLASGRLIRVENIALEYFFKDRPAIKADSSIAMIEIGEESLRSIGRWPWPWHYHAKMIRLLNEWGAKAIVFDFFFDESIAALENDDLEKALEQAKQVYFPVMLGPKPEKKFWIHSLPVVLEPKGEGKIWTHSAAKLEKNVRALGHINAETDDDGVLRRISPYLAYGQEIHPYLALKVAYDQTGKPLRDFDELNLPLDADGKLFVNWTGKWKNSCEHYAYADLIRSYQELNQGLRPVLDPKVVKDKICLIGLTAGEFSSTKVNAFESACPSIAVHANVINSILTNQFVIPVAVTTNALCLVLVGFITSLLFVNFRNTVSFVMGLAIGVIWVVVCFMLFWFKGIWLYVFHELLLILTLFIFSALYSLVMSGLERARLFDLATRDGLTGLYVIRYFREVLNRTVKEALIKKAFLSLILIDIDNFKPVNDTYSHQAGDMVLR